MHDKRSFSGRRECRAMSNIQNLNKATICHPELVEVFLSEKREKTASLLAKRDLVWNLGGLLFGCYICESKPPKLQAISHRRFAPRFLLGSSPRAAHSLTKTSTTKSRAIFPLRMTGRLFVLLYTFVRKHVCCCFFLYLYSFSRISNIFLRKTVIFSHIFWKNSLLFYYFMLSYGVR